MKRTLAFAAFMIFSCSSIMAAEEAAIPPAAVSFLRGNPGAAQALERLVLRPGQEPLAPEKHLEELLKEATPDSVRDDRLPQLAAALAAVVLAARPHEIDALGADVSPETAGKLRAFGPVFRRLAELPSGEELLQAARQLDLMRDPFAVSNDLSLPYDLWVKKNPGGNTGASPEGSATPRLLPAPEGASDHAEPALAPGTLVIEAGESESDYLAVGDAVKLNASDFGLNVGQEFFAKSGRVTIKSLEEHTGKAILVNEKGEEQASNMLFLAFAEKTVIRKRSPEIEARLAAKPKAKAKKK